MEKGRGIHRTLNSVIFRTVANPGFNCVGVRRHCTSILLFLSPLLSLPPPTHSTVPPPPPPPKVVFGGFQFHSILLLLLLSTSPPAVNTLPLPLPLPFHPKGTFFSGNLLAFVSFSLVVRRYRLESRLLLLLLSAPLSNSFFLVFSNRSLPPPPPPRLSCFQGGPPPPPPSSHRSSEAFVSFLFADLEEMYPRAGMSFVPGLWLYVFSALFFVTLIGRSFPFSLFYSGTFLASIVRNSNFAR